MANIATFLREEISRLSRREIRKHVQPLRKATATYRREIASLKRAIVALQRRANALAKSAIAQSEPAAQEDAAPPLRFVAKGLRSLRARLDLSAADLAKLIGVSQQSVYNWEAKKTVPRREQVTAIAGLRALGKREARARLEEKDSRKKAKKAPRKARRNSKA
jgi:DNA-binding XRE family transcriptional regulator